ncbi:leucine-rich repeat protein [Mycoplasmopsis opalescens]|uniref:leucine-rich repeat protein n=1 Tax=Mycoplasmopsis opalescens TaxID=114886 RepID=UPI0038CD8E72
MTSINLPNVKEIGYRAFYGAISLTNVIAPNLERIGADAFDNTWLPKGYKIGKVTV